MNRRMFMALLGGAAVVVSRAQVQAPRIVYGPALGVGASTISWYGSPIDVTVAPANADGAVAIGWVSPTSDGRALLRPDGFAAQLTRSAMPAGGRPPEREIMTVEALAQSEASRLRRP